MKHETHIEIPITVCYEYTPACPATCVDPEVFEEITINSVTGRSVWVDGLLTGDQREAIITEIRESIAAEYEGIA